MDKIVYFKEGKVNNPAGQYNTTTIPHNLGFAPLLFGLCSLNSDFTNTRSLPFIDTANPNGSFLFGADSSKNNIILTIEDVNGRLPSTLYYRLYGFEPTTSAAKVGATSKYAKNFILNTDYNYCKLYKKGTVRGDIDSSLTHNLGYIPQFLAWIEYTDAFGDIITTAIDNTIINSDGSLHYGIFVNSNKINFKFSNFGVNGAKVHYRIYYDET